MKGLIVLFICLIFPAVSVATECSIPKALSYVYGGCFGTDGNEHKITEWTCVDPQPDVAQIALDVAECSIQETRAEKIQSIKDYALSLVPEFTDFGTFKAFAELYQSIDNKTPTAWVSNVISVRVVAIATVSTLNGYSSQQDLDNYDTINDPGWP